MRIGVSDNHTRGGNKVDVYLDELEVNFPSGTVFVREEPTKLVFSPTDKPGYRGHSIQKSGKIGFNSRTRMLRMSVREIPVTCFCGEFVVLMPRNCR